MTTRRFLLGLALAAAGAVPPASAQDFGVAPSTQTAPSTAPVYGVPIPADRGPWVIGDVRFSGARNVSEFTLSNRVRARRGSLYTPSDVAGDLAELRGLANVASARADLYAIPGQAVPENYAAIAVSTLAVRIVYSIEEKVLFLPGLTQSTATATAARTAADAAVPPVSISGIVLTPTAYRGVGRNNRPGLALDINAAYYIGRLYGKNTLDYTTKKTNFIDRIGVWFLSVDGKMQVQSEAAWRPAMAFGAQGIFTFRDAPQPSLQTPGVSVKVSEKTTKSMGGGYFVLSKQWWKARSSLGFMQGNAGDQVASLTEFLTPQALLFSGHPNQTATSKSVLFGSVLFLPKPQYPLAVEFIKPNGMALKPILLNFKLGYFLKLNFDVAYLRFQGGWDLLGTFQFRYSHYPKR